MRDIQRLTADEALAVLPQLVALLTDAVQDGASIDFTPPLSANVADGVWQDSFA